MPDSYSVKAILSASDKGFSSTINGALGSLKSFAKSATFGMIQGAGMAAFNSLKNSVTGMMGALNSSAASWKTFESSMAMLGATADEIAGTKKKLQSFAEETIYSSSDMATTYAQLAAVGVKSADDLVMAFGGLAAAAENPTQAMKTLSQQATQMAAKPTVAWQDFKLMLEQTPAGIAQVAKAMGMTTSELVSAVQDGTVATEDFFAAMKKAGGAGSDLRKMATQYKTMDQAMDGLQETLANKLTPAFNALSNHGISALSGIVDLISKIDGEGLAARVSGWVEKAQPLFKSFQSAAANVFKVIQKAGAAVAPVFTVLAQKIGNGVKKIMDWFSQIDANKVGNAISRAIVKAAPYWQAFEGVIHSLVGAAKTALPYIVNFAKTIGNFFLDNSDTISKCIPWVIGLVGAFKGLQVVNKVAPAFASFGRSLASMAAKGVSGLASKLFGIGTATKSTGTAAGAAAKELLAAGAAFLLVGVGVLAIAGGFALLAQSAIALSNAGGLAIGLFAAMVVGVVALGVGMAFLLKSMAASSATILPAAAALLMVGAAVLLVAAGFALLVQSSIALANAGWGAIAVMAGMVAVIALLAVGAAALGAALTAGAVGFIAFGAALLMAGVGAILAATALVILSAALPALVEYGLQGAVSILALGAALLVFGAAALVAGAGALVLGAGLLVCAAAVLVLAAGVVVLGVGMMLIGIGANMAAAGLEALAAVLPVLAKDALSNAAGLLILSGGLAAFGAAALVAGAGVAVFGAALLVVGAGLLMVGAALLVISVSALIAAGAIALLSLALPALAEHGAESAGSLVLLGGAMAVFAAGAAIAGAAAVLLGAGLLVVGAGLLVISAATLITAAGVLALAAGALVLGASLAVILGTVTAMTILFPLLAAGVLLSSGAFTLLTALSIALSGALLLSSAGLLAVTASAALALVSVAAFGAAALVAAAGVLILSAGLLLVQSSMAGIAGDAKKAENSLVKMVGAVNVVEEGLNKLGDMAEDAIEGLFSIFEKSAGDAKQAGRALSQNYVSAVQTGLVSVTVVTQAAILMMAAALNSGRVLAYNAGANISAGFALGMRSQLGAVRSAAAQLAAEADKAVRAKAKIHSPSKITEESGAYMGIGLVRGMMGMLKKVQRAGEKLFTVPSVNTPELVASYNGKTSEEYSYYRDTEFTFDIPVVVDGREIARATATHMQSEIDRENTRNSRRYGIV